MIAFAITIVCLDIGHVPRAHKHFVDLVITIFRLTWMTTKIKWSRHRSFLYECDRSPGMHVLKLEIEISNLKQHS